MHVHAHRRELRLLRAHPRNPGRSATGRETRLGIPKKSTNSQVPTMIHRIHPRTRVQTGRTLSCTHSTIYSTPRACHSRLICICTLRRCMHRQHCTCVRACSHTHNPTQCHSHRLVESAEKGWKDIYGYEALYSQYLNATRAHTSMHPHTHLHGVCCHAYNNKLLP